jgi:hypothetical protein
MLDARLKAVALTNFKAFGERTRIEFAPITLFFGENCAGKSSILQVLNLLKQTLELGDSPSPLLPFADRGYVNLGNFHEFAHDHNTSERIQIELEMELLSQSRLSALLEGDGHVTPRRADQALPTRGLTLSFASKSVFSTWRCERGACFRRELPHEFDRIRFRPIRKDRHCQSHWNVSRAH